MFQTITANRIGSLRKETLVGKEYQVIPVRMIVPGVLTGNRGPLLYRENEIAKSVHAWNNVPIVINHPQKDGKYISARQPEVLEKYGVGYVFNAQIKNGNLDGEAWVDLAALHRIDPSLAVRVEEGERLEISTGLGTENLSANGKFQGKEYTHIAQNFAPDHLAILPDTKGACSLEDGCGLSVNEAKEYIEAMRQAVTEYEEADSPLPFSEWFLTNGSGSSCGCKTKKKACSCTKNAKETSEEEEETKPLSTNSWSFIVSNACGAGGGKGKPGFQKGNGCARGSGRAGFGKAKTATPAQKKAAAKKSGGSSGGGSSSAPKKKATAKKATGGSSGGSLSPHSEFDKVEQSLKKEMKGASASDKKELQGYLNEGKRVKDALASAGPGKKVSPAQLSKAVTKGDVVAVTTSKGRKITGVVEAIESDSIRIASGHYGARSYATKQGGFGSDTIKSSTVHKTTKGGGTASGSGIKHKVGGKWVDGPGPTGKNTSVSKLAKDIKSSGDAKTMGEAKAKAREELKTAGQPSAKKKKSTKFQSAAEKYEEMKASAKKPMTGPNVKTSKKGGATIQYDTLGIKPHTGSKKSAYMADTPKVAQNFADKINKKGSWNNVKGKASVREEKGKYGKIYHIDFEAE